MRTLAVLPCLLLALPAAALELEWIGVRDAGNPGDTEVMTCCLGLEGGTGFGAVGYDFAISRHEITNAAYAEFLNQVGDADPGGLYNESMGSDALHGGITRSGSDGSYSYSAKPGFESKPVVYVSIWDVLRFVNWLHNGQPAGAQGPSTTEGGAYTLTPAGIAANDIVRNAGASVFLTSEDEWYKAAYYDPALPGYSDYATGTDAELACLAPVDDQGNAANCDLTSVVPVGSYTLSRSAYGTLDQGGNAWEWNETILPGPFRGVRGGAWNEGSPDTTAASARFRQAPTNEALNVSFRVARTVPEPSRVLLALVGALLLAGSRRRAAPPRAARE
jgi:formylglycine-generating enzyme